ncbi:unnamed protein product, partial [Prunus armeniaca]
VTVNPCHSLRLCDNCLFQLPSLSLFSLPFSPPLRTIIWRLRLYRSGVCWSSSSDQTPAFSLFQSLSLTDL